MASSTGENGYLDKITATDAKKCLVGFRQEDLKLLEKAVSCIRCSKIVIPKYYMICQENGHIICGECAWPMPQTLAPSRKSTFTPPANLAPPTCCDPENLIKGSQAVMKGLLEMGVWECMYKDKGCTFRGGRRKWRAHVGNCKFMVLQPCYAYKCSEKFHTLGDLMNHFKKDHGIKIFDMSDVWTIDVSIAFDDNPEAPNRKLTVFKRNENYLLFASEICENKVHVWIWDLNFIEEFDQTRDDRKYRLNFFPKKRSSSDDSSMLVYEGKLQSMTKPPETLISSGVYLDCCSIGIPQLKELNPLVEGSHQWDVTVKVAQLPKASPPTNVPTHASFVWINI